MICPVMSKLVGYPYQDEYDRHKTTYELETIECKKSECALWNIIGGSEQGQCGLRGELKP